MINPKNQLKSMMAQLLSAYVAVELIEQNDMRNITMLLDDAVKRKKNKPIEI